MSNHQAADTPVAPQKTSLKCAARRKMEKEIEIEVVGM